MAWFLSVLSLSRPRDLRPVFQRRCSQRRRTLANYAVTQSGRAPITEPNNIISQGLTYHLFNWWSLDLDYRYSRFTSNSVGDFNSLFDATTPSTAATDSVWRDGLSDLIFSMDFKPMPSLIIRPGVQFLKSDVEALTNGVIDPEITLRTKSVRPVISFGYDPSKVFSIRGDFRSMNSGASYTAITPHTQQIARFVLRYRPTEKLSIEDEVNVGDYKLLTTNFENTIRSNAITVFYSLAGRLSVFAGFSYDSYYAQGNILYVRGTPPLSDSLQDQELNRVWSGGIDAKLFKRAGIRLSGNFDRSSGVGAITGEPRLTARSLGRWSPELPITIYPKLVGSPWIYSPTTSNRSLRATISAPTC